MIKFEIHFFNRFANENQIFYLVATNEIEAENLFYLKHPKELYHNCIEHVYEYYEPHFYTKEELVKNIK